MSREKMINFTGDMVRAILDGSKTMTRRPLKTQPPEGYYVDFYNGGPNFAFWKGNKMHEPKTFKPSLQPGDTMLVRERARCIEYFDGKYPRRAMFKYEADGAKSGYTIVPVRLKRIKIGHCVPNGCFKELVRIKRKVVRVWYERIADITKDDAKSEGVDDLRYINPIEAMWSTWEKIYPGSWDRNDWVECTEFEGAGK